MNLLIDVIANTIIFMIIGLSKVEKEMKRIICKDGTNWLCGSDSSGAKQWIAGSVNKKRSRDIHDEKCGEYPVFRENFGSYRLFTYSSKIEAILED